MGKDLEATATGKKSKSGSGKKGKGDKDVDLSDTADQLLLSGTVLQDSHKGLEDRLSKLEKSHLEHQQVHDDKQTRSADSRPSDTGGKDTEFLDNSREENSVEPPRYDKHGDVQ